MSSSKLGFKRHLSWNDAVHGTTDNRINNNHSLSKNSTVVANSLIWTAVNN